MSTNREIDVRSAVYMHNVVFSSHKEEISFCSREKRCKLVLAVQRNLSVSYDKYHVFFHLWILDFTKMCIFTEDTKVEHKIRNQTVYGVGWEPMVRGNGEHGGVGDDSAEMSNHLKLNIFVLWCMLCKWLYQTLFSLQSRKIFCISTCSLASLYMAPSVLKSRGHCCILRWYRWYNTLSAEEECVARSHCFIVCVFVYRSQSLEHSRKMFYHWLNFQPYKSLFLQSLFLQTKAKELLHHQQGQRSWKSGLRKSTLGHQQGWRSCKTGNPKVQGRQKPKKDKSERESHKCSGELLFTRWKKAHAHWSHDLS